MIKSIRIPCMEGSCMASGTTLGITEDTVHVCSECGNTFCDGHKSSVTTCKHERFASKAHENPWDVAVTAIEEWMNSVDPGEIGMMLSEVVGRGARTYKERVVVGHFEGEDAGSGACRVPGRDRLVTSEDISSFIASSIETGATVGMKGKDYEKIEEEAIALARHIRKQLKKQKTSAPQTPTTSAPQTPTSYNWYTGIFMGALKLIRTSIFYMIDIAGTFPVFLRKWAMGDKEPLVKFLIGCISSGPVEGTKAEADQQKAEGPLSKCFGWICKLSVPLLRSFSLRVVQYLMDKFASVCNFFGFSRDVPVSDAETPALWTMLNAACVIATLTVPKADTASVTIIKRNLLELSKKVREIEFERGIFDNYFDTLSAMHAAQCSATGAINMESQDDVKGAITKMQGGIRPLMVAAFGRPDHNSEVFKEMGFRPKIKNKVQWQRLHASLTQKIERFEKFRQTETRDITKIKNQLAGMFTSYNEYLEKSDAEFHSFVPRGRGQNLRNMPKILDSLAAVSMQSECNKYITEIHTAMHDLLKVGQAVDVERLLKDKLNLGPAVGVIQHGTDHLLIRQRETIKAARESHKFVFTETVKSLRSIIVGATSALVWRMSSFGVSSAFSEYRDISASAMESKVAKEVDALRDRIKGKIKGLEDTPEWLYSEIESAKKGAGTNNAALDHLRMLASREYSSLSDCKREHDKILEWASGGGGTSGGGDEDLVFIAVLQEMIKRVTPSQGDPVTRYPLAEQKQKQKQKQPAVEVEKVEHKTEDRGLSDYRSGKIPEETAQKIKAREIVATQIHGALATLIPVLQNPDDKFIESLRKYLSPEVIAMMNEKKGGDEIKAAIESQAQRDFENRKLSEYISTVWVVAEQIPACATAMSYLNVVDQWINRLWAFLCVVRALLKCLSAYVFRTDDASAARASVAAIVNEAAQYFAPTLIWSSVEGIIRLTLPKIAATIISTIGGPLFTGVVVMTVVAKYVIGNTLHDMIIGRRVTMHELMTGRVAAWLADLIVADKSKWTLSTVISKTAGFVSTVPDYISAVLGYTSAISTKTLYYIRTTGRGPNPGTSLDAAPSASGDKMEYDCKVVEGVPNLVVGGEHLPYTSVEYGGKSYWFLRLHDGRCDVGELKGERLEDVGDSVRLGVETKMKIKPPGRK